MKYQYVTINTGHVMRGDSDVDLAPAVVPLVRELLRSGRGEVQGTEGRVRYRFDRDPGIAAAALTVSGRYQGMPAPIWTTLFYLDERAAGAAHEELFKMGANLGLSQHEFPALAAPGLATLLLQGVALVPASDVFMLADFAKTLFMVWALDGGNGAGPAVE